MNPDGFILRMLQSGIGGATERLSKFAADIESSPVSAFDWSGSAFEAAAIKQVYGEALKFLQSGDSIAVLRLHAQREVNRRALRGSRLTSDASNLMTAEMMSAWARLLDMLHDGGAA